MHDTITCAGLNDGIYHVASSSQIWKRVSERNILCNRDVPGYQATTWPNPAAPHVSVFKTTRHELSMNELISPLLLAPKSSSAHGNLYPALYIGFPATLQALTSDMWNGMARLDEPQFQLSSELEALWGSTWATKRKYGDRASSCGSSAHSRDSRLAEDFLSSEVGSPGNNGPPPPVPFSLLPYGSPTSPPHHTKHETPPHKRLRRNRILDNINKGKTRQGSALLPGPRNPREAYLKTRAIIRTYSKTAPQESIDQSSSCASIIADEEKLRTTETVLNAGTYIPKNINVLDRMRSAVVKWRSRMQFFEFTSDNREPSTHTWRRRRTLAKQLVSTSSKGDEWAELVARRFNKTTARQIAGLRAILRLRVEEEDYNSSIRPGTTLQSDYAGRSYDLLDLLFIRFQPKFFFQEVVSSVLRDWQTDKAWVIAWLVTVVPNFRTSVDLDVLSSYGQKVIQNSPAWSHPWLTGLWLLLTLFTGQITPLKERPNILSLAKLILHVGMDAFGNRSSRATTNHSLPDESSKLKVLYSILSTCVKCDDESLRFALPSTIILQPFVEACVDAVSANGLMTCSALKALALLNNIPTGIENLLPERTRALASCCMNIVLGGGFWDKSAISEECITNAFKFIPEEDAFDILCRLPQPIFSTALAAALDNCPVSLDPSSQDHLKLFDILEPLLWLSNMPTSAPEAHCALVMGGACEFLAKIILDSPQETWLWRDRAIWRIKGEAITCLGNIIEKMDQPELRSHLREDIVKTIADIRDNTEAPLVQRDQAMFTLVRYKAAAGCRNVEPLCKERLKPEPVDPNGEGGQCCQSVSNADPAIRAVAGEAS